MHRGYQQGVTEARPVSAGRRVAAAAALGLALLVAPATGPLTAAVRGGLSGPGAGPAPVAGGAPSDRRAGPDDVMCSSSGWC